VEARAGVVKEGNQNSVRGGIKANSSKWMNEHEKRFAWQEGYGAFSASVSNTAAVANYIRDQELHHRKLTFEDEYLALLRKHGVEFDPKHVFG
jgi:putative transposase